MRDALRPVVALCVVSLAAAALPSAAAADTPSVTSSVDGIAGNNNWWRGSTHGNNVILHWTVTANPPLTNTSGCDPAITINGPATGVTKTCTATNDDGTTSVSRTIKIDADPPTGVSASPARGPDAHGWYNHAVGLTWSGTDATSGIASCTTSSYSGPDNGAASAPGNCQDNAGNVIMAPFSLKYDETDPSVSVSPSRAANGNGWYTSPLTITWSGADTTSGIGSCSPSVPYSGPDDASVSLSGACVDNAGNTGTTEQFDFKYDGTPPQVTVSPSSQPNANGWYSSPVTATWNGSDATSGANCSPPKTYSGPDDANASLPGSCTNGAGTTQSDSFDLKYDVTDPQITNVATARPADANGWFNHSVGLSWSDGDATSGIAGCSSPPYSGPDTTAVSLSVTCTDRAGNSASKTTQIKYDSTPPHITGATLSRPPDFNGWYTHPVTITWSGTDALSGIASCTSAPYSGQATALANAVGSCTDRAGNVAASAIALKYDGTAPTLSKVSVASRAASDLVRWTSTSPEDQIVVKRSVRGSKDEQVVFQGTGSRVVDSTIEPGVEYEYAIVSTDQADNVSKTAAVAGLPKILTLRKMAYIPRAAPKPILQWAAMKAASYYHVQVFRGSKRILAAWPSKRQLGLTNAWRWAGRRYTLGPGRYRWFVWGGLGKRSFARYHAIGSARFIVPSR